MESPTPAPARKIYRVTELTRRIKAVLEDDIGAVWVEGEVSNARAYPSGHVYFTLKDEAAQLSAVLFRNVAAANPVPVKDGAKLRLYGELTVYEQRGQYQLVVRRVENAGLGDLHLKFEELKARLQAEGLFDPARKRPLPVLPSAIGVVTSPAGAVIRDILHVLARRFPDRHILLAPARVQGAGAAEEIAGALDQLNRAGGVEVIIVARGGGSLEDLWAFNEEVVARAVARSAVPVISAVGHETDFTICDFVADLRAPTPSAAAELVIGRKADFEERIRVLRRRLAHALRARSLEWRNRLTRAARSYVFREPRHLLDRHRDRVARLGEAAARAIEGALNARRQRRDEAGVRIAHLAQLRARDVRARLARAETALRNLNPTGVLRRGYSITFGPRGAPLLDARDAEPGQALKTVLAHGTLESRVIESHPEEQP